MCSAPLTRAVPPSGHARRLLGEDQAHARAIGGGLAGGRVVHLEHQRRPLRQPHRGALGVDARPVAGHEAAERSGRALRLRPGVGERRLLLAVWQFRPAGLSGGNVHALGEGHRAARPRPRRRAGRRRVGGRTQVDDHVVDGGGVARPHFPRLDPAILVVVRRHLEVDVGNLAAGGDRIVLLHLEHGVGRADLPAGRVGRRGRQVLRIALGRAGLDPPRNRRLLRVGQPPLVREVPDGGIGVPRRHRAVLHLGGDGPRPGPGVLVGEQRHRRHLARAMAGRALREEDRRHVAREGRRGRRGLRRRRVREQERGDEHHQASESHPHGPNYAPGRRRRQRISPARRQPRIQAPSRRNPSVIRA